MPWDLQTQEMVVDDLRRVEGINGGQVPAAYVQHLSVDTGVPQSTIWRWLRDDRYGNSRTRETSSHPSELTAEMIAVIFDNFGDIAKAKRDLDKTHPEIEAMSEATFRRRWKKIDPAIRAAAKGGGGAVHRYQVKILFEAESRNDLWHIDHSELPVWVIPAGSQTAVVKPWLTTVIDDSTRRIMSVHLTMEHPDTEHTLVALADAMRSKPIGHAGHSAGGVPLQVMSDNGGEFRSHHFKQALARLGVRIRRTYPYSSYQNGKVERVQGSLQDEVIAKLPGHSSAPRTQRMADLYGLEGPVLVEEALHALILDWVDRYNSERGHDALGGRTPDEVWTSQSTPLKNVDPAALRMAMLASENSYTVHPTGISFQKRWYTSPGLAKSGLIGKKVNVRFLPNDPTFIEIFDDEKWVCTGFLHKNLTAAQKKEIIDIRIEQATVADAHYRAGVQRRRDRVDANPDLYRTPDGDSRKEPEPDDDYVERTNSSTSWQPPQPTGGIVIPEGAPDDPFDEDQP